MTATIERTDLDWVTFSSDDGEVCQGANDQECPLEAVARSVWARTCEHIPGTWLHCAAHLELLRGAGMASQWRLRCPVPAAPDRAGPVTAVNWAEALTVSCGWCGSEENVRCWTPKGPRGTPHRRRVKLARVLAGHSDPALDALWPKRGSCWICGTPGLDQRHRVIDAIAERLWADEETEEELAGEFGVTVEAVAVVRDWALRHPEAWQ